MVDVMEARIDGGNARLRLASVRPKLCHIYFARFVVPPRIPRNHFFAQRTHERHHFGNEVRVGKLHFIGSDMDVGNIGKDFGADFRHQFFQDFHSFFRLHIHARGTHKSRAVSRHINFGNKQHIVLAAPIGNFARVGDGVELSGKTLEIGAVGKLRKNLALQSPTLIFRQMPMKSIDFVSGKNFDFAFQFFHRDKTASHIVHKSADAESGKVGNGKAGNRFSVGRFHNLAQRLFRPIGAFWRGGFDTNFVG